MRTGISPANDQFCEVGALSQIIEDGGAVAGRESAGVALDRQSALQLALEREVMKSRQDRERLDLALAASGMISVWDGDLVAGLVYGDANFARIYGLDPAETQAGHELGHYFTMIHPDDLASARAAMDRMFAGTDVYDDEHRIIRPDGTVIWVLARGRLLRDAAGKPVRFTGVSVNVTERKRTETRQAFLVGLQDLLRGLADPEAIMDTAAAALGRHLGANRIGFGRVLPDGETVLVRCGFADGLPPVNGIFPLAVFGAGNVALARLGRTTVINDVLDGSGTGEAWAELGTRAHVSVPLIRDDEYRGSLYVTYARPRDWRDDEVSLIEEVAARIWDAAERGRAEMLLRDSEARARLALASGEFGSWEYDVGADRVAGSLRHNEIFGGPAATDGWSAARYLETVVPEDLPRMAAGLRHVIEAGADWLADFRITPVSGGERWIEIRAKAQLDAMGKVTRLLGTTADITERKRAEAALVASEAQFRTLAQAMPNQVWTARPDGMLDWFNERCLDYSGRTSAELAGSGWTVMVHPDELPNAARNWAASLQSGENYETEFRLLRADGVYRWYIARAVALRGADGAVVRWIGTNTDIEDQKVSAAALAALNATLEAQVEERTAELMAAEETLRQSQKMEAVGQLTGGIAHDFNNMLQGIAGAVELMERRIAQGRPEEAGRYVAAARQSVARAATLTHQLLAFSRRQALAPKRVDLSELIGGIAGLIQQTVGPAVDFDVRLRAENWLVRCDPNQMENAILNLAINARDAMLPGGGALTLETMHVVLRDADVAGWDGATPGPYVRLTVTDTGSGMSADIMRHAFEPFFTTKPAGQGTGLGLSQVYGFVRQSSGIMRLESELGRGTSVHLYLPRHADTAAPAAVPESQPVVAAPAQGARILLVEDEAPIRAFAAEALRDLGHEVVEAKDAAEGLRALRAMPRPVDLLLADIGLPGGMNGRQLADAARELVPTLKVLLITGYAGTALGPDTETAPDIFLLSKPFSLAALAARVETILAGPPCRDFVG
jgi:PAS domain S-box-containing protein